MTDPLLTGRRPLKSRQSKLFQRLAAWLARSGVTPNAISFSSIIFAGGAGAALVATSFWNGWPQRACWIAAALLIQLRLLANLFDGLVAVEGGKGGPTGELWNEAPDRVADALIFIGAGFAATSSPILGVGAALGAVFVAYVRALGASVGAGQIFVGPLAKPQRMFVMTMLCLIAAIVLPHARESFAGDLSDPMVYLTLHDTYYVIVSPWKVPLSAISLVLVAIIVGCVITALRRLLKIAEFLRSRSRA